MYLQGPLGCIWRTTSSEHNYGPRGGAPFTKDQYGQIIKLLKKTIIGINEAYASATSIPKCLALLVTNCPEWIVDTGATNHKASSLNMLDQASLAKPPYPKRVHLPNGELLWYHT